MDIIFHTLKEVVIITIGQMYTGKYHEFVDVCIATSVQKMSDISSIACYYGDNQARSQDF